MVINLVVCTLIKTGHRDCHIIVKLDNPGVVGALAAECSQSVQQNIILYDIVDVFKLNSI